MSIIISEKTDEIQWNVIKKVIDKSHEDLRIKKNIIFKATPTDVDAIKEKIGEKGRCFVASDDKKVCGTVSVGIEKLNYLKHSYKIARIRYVAVLPEYQGRHIATMLLRKSIEWCGIHGYDMICVSTRADNDAAIYLYRKMGFRMAHYYKVEDYYCVFMIKDSKNIIPPILYSIKYYSEKFFLKFKI